MYTITALILALRLAAALPIISERAAEAGILNPLSAILGNDPVTMAKALPDKHVDPSPLGIDNIISNLPIPDLDLRRDLPLNLDGPTGGADGAVLDLADIAGPHPHGKASEGGGILASEQLRLPNSGHALPHISDLPLVGNLIHSAPLASAQNMLGARAHEGSPSNHVKRLVRKAKAKRRASTYTGAQELNDNNDAPHWY